MALVSSNPAQERNDERVLLPLPVDPEFLTELDAFIADSKPGLSRQDAIKAMVQFNLIQWRQSLLHGAEPGTPIPVSSIASR